MELGYPNGVTAKDIPYEAQIIRVADEFEAISAKRQYKTHVGIVETLNMLINDTKSKPVTTLQEGLKIMAEETTLGKIDRKIVKALFKVSIDDIEYEISARTDYIEYLKSEIKRVKEALKYYTKMQAASSSRKKEYYRAGARACLRKNEDVDLLPNMYEELKHSLRERTAHIEKLYSEVRQIKHLRV